MDERLRFVAEYLRGERSLAALCRTFGISRKTGYKMINRYADEGLRGLFDRSRAPHRQANIVSDEVFTEIVRVRRAHPHWGPRKLLAWLEREQPRSSWPAASTIGRILARQGLVVPRRRARRSPPYTEPFRTCDRPNAVWCADLKGWFRTADGSRCEPLTVTDAYSRYLLRCQSLPRVSHAEVRPVFEQLFREYGLPGAIRTDNGAPFATTALAGLSRLAVWWIKLGIVPERIEPGHPEQNGRHERFHRTLKQETVTPPKGSLAEQQVAFDCFREEYNRDRPHEALADRTPATLYRPSTRPFPSRLPEMTYPENMLVRKVRPSGRIRWQGGELFISEALIGEPVALEPISDHSFQVYYGPVTLAIYDEKKAKLLRPSAATKE
jgi:transposase InsO family protein